MRNSFRVLTDCALRSPGIMERMPAASVTPAAVRYLDITYSFLVKWQGHQEIHSMMIAVIGNRSDGDTETYKDHIAYEKNTSVCLDKQINDPNRKNNEIRFYIYLE